MSECPFQSRLSAFHDHELDADLAFKIESHLSDCQQCTESLRGIRAVSRLLSGAGAGTSNTSQMSQIGVARLHAVADAAAKRRDVFPLARALLAVAASVLVIAGAWLYETPAPIQGGKPFVSYPDGKQEAAWEKMARGVRVNSLLEPANETGVAVKNRDFSKWMLDNLKSDSGS